MNNKNDISCLSAKKPLPLLCALIVGGLPGTSQVQAGGFMMSTTNTAGWGRTMAGGSLSPNDPSATSNNPAAMTSIDKRIAQLTVNYADIDIKYDGDAHDHQGNPMTGGYQDGLGTPELATSDGGQAGFSAWLPTGLLVVSINNRFASGPSQVVPMGMYSTWDPNWKGRDFTVDTKIETIGLTGPLSFKVNDNFSLGAGVIIQRAPGFVSQNLDLYASAANSPGTGRTPFPASNSSALMRVKVDNTSPGLFAGAVWKPTDRGILGPAYHAKIHNKLKGHYNLYGRDGGLTEGVIEDGTPGLAYPNLDLRMGVFAPARPDIPAYASLDWVHQFSDRLSLGASATWTEWSLFQDLTLKSHDNMIVSILHTYRNTQILAMGGDYKVTDQWTMHAGAAYGQASTHNTTRDPRIPDGDRYFASLGAGYRFQLMPELSIDVVHSRQSIKEVPSKTVNQDHLGGGRLDGKVTNKGQVFSLSTTRDFQTRP